ncbi:MAG: hypothetical protein CV087_23525 [Candidatus Brocadia sp. WS118]|nr:MAG: hypothetical protein CV087_23525 [Candidatus Brocadia sp. WS118]
MPAEKIPIEEIRTELQSIRGELARFGSFLTPFVKDHSDWSAHGKWSSGHKNLLGDFSLSTRIGLPSSTQQLDKIISESSSTRFLEVAKSLGDLLIEQ